MNLDKIKSSIRAMLNLASNHAASQGEKDNAMTHVQRLMEEHNLREEDLADADGLLDSLDNVAAGKYKINMGKRQCMWHASLAMFVKELLATVEAYCVKNKSSNTVDIVFYGVMSDCEIAAEIFIEVRDMIDLTARKKYGGAKKGDGYRYSMGFTGGLQEQLRRLQAIRPSSSTALVVARHAIVVRKQAIAKKVVTDEGPGTFQKQSTRTPHDDAYVEGWDTGLHHTVNPDRRKKLTA